MTAPPDIVKMTAGTVENDTPPETFGGDRQVGF